MLVKPLLGFLRSEIVAYAKAHNLEFREDASNASPDHTRNRIRHELMPLLEESFNLQIRDAVLRLAEQSRWTNEFVNDAAINALNKVVINRDDGVFALDRVLFVELPTIIQASVVRLVLEALGTRERRLTFRHITDILDGVSACDTKGRFTLPDGVDVQFDRTTIRLSRHAAQTNESGLQ